MKQILKSIVSLFLCTALLGPCAAFAEEDVTPFHLDTDALDEMMYAYISSHSLNPENISIGYYYSGNDERYYFNENKWYYSASTYKVPLMMIFAEREHNGELSLESNINGLTLEYAEQSILVYSNNDFAHLVMHYIGTDRECRELYQRYSDLPVDYYDPDFYDYSYFTARFLTDVVVTLYKEPERFPHIIDRLKEAQPGEYFRKYLENEYEIAQKYGSYTDWSSRDFNHTTGIIYTEHPFVLTVMTLNTPGYMGVIGDLAGMFAEYTESLEEQYDQWEQEKLAAAEAARRAEEEARRQEQAAQATEETPAPVLTPAPAAESPAAETQLPEQNPEPEATNEKTFPGKFLMGVVLFVLAAVLLAVVLSITGQNRKRRQRRHVRSVRENAVRQNGASARTRRTEPTPEKREPAPERRKAAPERKTPVRQERHYTPKH